MLMVHESPLMIFIRSGFIVPIHQCQVSEFGEHDISQHFATIYYFNLESEIS